jgi:hypothetical protein
MSNAKDAENLVTSDIPCACSTFYALENVRDDTETGDLVWDAEYNTGCQETTKNTFAPGHDAKLKGFLIKMSDLDVEIHRTEGGMSITAGPIEHAQKYGFSVQVAAGIQRKARIRAERHLKRMAKEAGKGESAETKAVMLALQTSQPNDMWQPIGLTLLGDTPEAFIDNAKAWLKDKTELSGKQIDGADWDVAYDHFRELADAS